MNHTTGLYRDEIEELCAMIHRQTDPTEWKWPPILGLFESVRVALVYLRRNRVQCDLAETFDVSQSTISRAITT
ncbi:transposase family protein, partial [Aeromicrobium sp.]|uniref:transposase family protein n=1 Tax=Aeromicrobium sp. TaxID=1871063 RepID=UPI0039E3CA59